MKDQKIASDVYKATRLLNQSLGAADKAGLEVEIETIVTANLGNPGAIVVNATVWKRLSE